MRYLIVTLLLIVGVMLLTNFGRGIQTRELDQLIVKTKNQTPLQTVIAPYKDITIIDSAKNIVRVPEDRYSEFQMKLVQTPGVNVVMPVEGEPRFNGKLYVKAIKDQITQISKGEFGFIAFKPSGKTYPVTDFLKQMIIRTASYLILGVAAGILTGYAICLLASLFARIGALLDWVHAAIMSMPDVLIVVLLQLFVILIDSHAGRPLLAVAQFGDVTPTFIPVTSIAVMPAAIVYGVLRNAIKREIGSGYIKTAYMKGLGYKKIVISHVLRNTRSDLLSVLPRAITAGITTMVAAEVLCEIMGLGGYAVGPNVLFVTSIAATSTILAVFSLLSTMVFNTIKRKAVLAAREKADA